MIRQQCSLEQIKNTGITKIYNISNGVVTPSIDIKGDLPDGGISVSKDCEVGFELLSPNFIGIREFPKNEMKIEKNNTKSIYVDYILNGTDPVLDSGMTPIKFINGQPAIADINRSWYNYTDKIYANTIVIKKSKINDYKDKIGKIVNPDDILAYFVWIPRYKYKLFNVGGLASTYTNGVCTANCPKEIEIVFESKDTPKSTGNSNGQWLTEPGFTLGTKELNGIWIGKFKSTGTKDIPTVLPNKVVYSDSKRLSEYYQVLNKFNTAEYGINSLVRMSRSFERSTAIYLSHSKYGIGSEILMNVNNNYITGCGGDPSNLAATSVCIDEFGEAENYPQSSTGNISGIFDLSGVKEEYTMSVMTDPSGNPRSGNSTNYGGSHSGFNGMLKNGSMYTGGIAFPDYKYLDLFKTGDMTTACNGAPCLGNGTLEFKGWYGNNISNPLVVDWPFLTYSQDFVFFYEMNGSAEKINQFKSGGNHGLFSHYSGIRVVLTN